MASAERLPVELSGFMFSGTTLLASVTAWFLAWWPIHCQPLWGAVHRPALFWYSIPLIVAFSLVYGATRHELMGPILQHAVRAAIWIACFMLAIFAVLWLVDWLFL